MEVGRTFEVRSAGLCAAEHFSCSRFAPAFPDLSLSSLHLLSHTRRVGATPSTTVVIDFMANKNDV